MSQGRRGILGPPCSREPLGWGIKQGRQGRRCCTEHRSHQANPRQDDTTVELPVRASVVTRHLRGARQAIDDGGRACRDHEHTHGAWKPCLCPLDGAQGRRPAVCTELLWVSVAIGKTQQFGLRPDTTDRRLGDPLAPLQQGIGLVSRGNRDQRHRTTDPLIVEPCEGGPTGLFKITCEPCARSCD